MNIKVALMTCVTFLISVGVVVTYVSQKERYILSPQGNAMYIFDSKTATLNYCTDKSCQMVTPQSIGPDAYAALAAAGMAMPNQPIMMQGQSMIQPIMAPIPNQASIIMTPPMMPAFPQVPMNTSQGSLVQPQTPPMGNFMQPQQQPVQVIMMAPPAQQQARMTPVAARSLAAQSQGDEQDSQNEGDSQEEADSQGDDNGGDSPDDQGEAEGAEA
jgi:hypothetical protein